MTTLTARRWLKWPVLLARSGDPFLRKRRRGMKRPQTKPRYGYIYVSFLFDRTRLAQFVTAGQLAPAAVAAAPAAVPAAA